MSAKVNSDLNKERNIIHYLKEFKSSEDFKKYVLISLFLLLIFEMILGISFNSFFSETMELKRKQNYESAWKNYLEQRWKIDLGKITGYIWWTDIWQKLSLGNKNQLISALNSDTTIRKTYDIFSVYLDLNSPPIYSLNTNKKEANLEIDREQIQKFFNLQSNKPGTIHTIMNLKDDNLFLVSVSSLCDNVGNPMYPGIAIFAFDLNKFLRMAEEVIPVKMKVKSGYPPVDIYHYLTIPKDFGLKKDYYIEIKPEFEIQSLVLRALLLFVSAQTILSLSLFIIIAPRYNKKKIAKLQKIIEATEVLNSELTKNIEELKLSQEEKEKSEIKYEYLVESSKDIIFSFDQNGLVLTANKAMTEFLGFKREDLIGKYFLDLAYNPEKKTDTLEIKLLSEKFEELKTNKSSVSFDMTFGTKNNEPLQLGVKWEYVKMRDSFIVFGKAFTVSEDSMLKYFEAENRKYVFNNYITLAEQVSQRITSNLIKYMDVQEVFNVRICVREIIINSIEHGNLNIDYEMKTKLKKVRGEYFRFLQERQKDPEYRNRRVTVHYSLKSDRVSFIIKDEGKGFDHKKMIADNAENANINFLDHGRGIFMTKNTFDKIKYNEPGNKVLLVKFFKSI